MMGVRVGGEMLTLGEAGILLHYTYTPNFILNSHEGMAATGQYPVSIAVKRGLVAFD